MAWLRFALCSLGVFGLAAACLPGTGPALVPDSVDAASVDLVGDSAVTRTDADLGDSFRLDGLTPSHGPFKGGTRARLDGRGFTTKLRVVVGGIEIDSASLLASDPTRAAIVTPAGPPGFVDVKIRDDASAKERTLKDAFFYDAIVLTPDSGATSGGTRLVIEGSGTSWATGTTVAIGGVTCSDVSVLSATKISCVSPIGTPGAKDVVVTPVSGDAIQARDAFTYSDSSDGYRGGLSGGALLGRVKILAFDQLLGTPIKDGFAIAGDNLATAKVGRTSTSGVVELADITGDTVTVTVAAKCHHPISFVDVPVDTVTVYLPPVLDPSCIQGDPQPLPGQSRYGGIIDGELVFPGAGEFERAGWTTVPSPLPGEVRAAYVFSAASDPSAVFSLPDATQRITPDTEGSTGYNYSLLVFPGNQTLYIVAGLEDRGVTPPKFSPYAMGVARGVGVPAQGHVTGVDVKIDILFDHQVTLGVTPPAPGPRGPDRFIGNVAVTLGNAGYAILPRGTRTSPLPTPPTIPFIGMPGLNNGLTGEEYVLGGIAATGPDKGNPASLVSRVLTTNADTTVSIGGFLPVPVLDQPGQGVWNGTHVNFTGAAAPADLTVMTVTSGAGLVEWTIVAPQGRSTFNLPDLGALPGPDPVGLRHGAVTTTINVARIEAFEYGQLRYGQLAPGPWAAYAYDVLGGAY